jgi:hypothetical protein
MPVMSESEQNANRLYDLDAYEQQLLAKRAEIDLALNSIAVIRGLRTISGSIVAMGHPKPLQDAVTESKRIESVVELKGPILDIVNRNPGFHAGQVRDELRRRGVPSNSKDLYASASVTLRRLADKGLLRRDATVSPARFYPEDPQNRTNGTEVFK